MCDLTYVYCLLYLIRDYTCIGKLATQKKWRSQLLTPTHNIELNANWLVGERKYQPQDENLPNKYLFFYNSFLEGLAANWGG